MPDDNLRRALAEVETDLLTSEAELSRLHRRVTFLRQSRAGLRGLLGLKDDAASDDVDTEVLREEPSAASDVRIDLVPDEQRPESIDAVRMILTEHPNKQIHIDTIRDEMKTRGWANPSWANPDAAVYAALKRLQTRDEDVERVDRRHWLLRSTPKTSSDTSEDLFNEMSEDES